jgi:Ras GTPase-activating protein 3
MMNLQNTSLTYLSPCRVSLWHHTSLSEDLFLGQVNVSTSEIDSSRAYHGWFQLSPRPPDAQSVLQDKVDLGTMRLSVSYSQDRIFPFEMYRPLQTLLLQTLEVLDITDSALYILSEVYKDKSSMARSLVRIFFKLGSLEQLLKRLIEHEVSVTSDPNTLFRGNSIATKMVDEFMKLIGLSYLRRTLQCCIDEIFESRKSCEIDPSKLCDGENIDVNMTNLLYFVEKILSAIVSSSLSCPRLMCRIFSLLSQAAVRKFPDKHSIVQYTAVSGFIFLRFFAPAILSPRLFQLRSEIPTPVVARTLTLISKTVQSMGNIGTLSNKSSGSHKEFYLAPLNEQLMDESHIRDIKTYLTAIADPTGGQDIGLDDLTYREGFLIKRSQGRRKGPKGPKNFKRRYFVLTGKSLTYAKSRAEAPLCEIRLSDMLAVERVDDQAFNMKCFRLSNRAGSYTCRPRTAWN